MRYIIVGAGAIGGVIGSRLHEHGHDVILVARGDNYRALLESGLRVQSPEGEVHSMIPVVAKVSEIVFALDDVVVLAVKGQDTLAIMRELSAVAPTTTAIVCAQNGVENERVALRHFPNVYAMCVICPSAHLSPGVVQVYAGPKAGVFDLGRWPFGTDATAEAIAADLESSQITAVARSDIASLKWGKLLSNIHNSIEALCGPGNGRELSRRVRDESRTVLTGAGIDVTEAERVAKERFVLVEHHEVADHPRGGGSSWQSLARGSGDIESDYLNGEMVLLGRLHGVATPVNELLQLRANEHARRREAPGTVDESEFLDVLNERSES